MIGRLTAEWTGRPLGCLFLVPLWNPVLLAEQVGTLAAMSPGRFIVQTGLGGGAHQFAAMGADVYREACSRHDREPLRVPIRKDVLVVKDRAVAERVGDALVAAGYRGFERAAVAYGDPRSSCKPIRLRTLVMPVGMSCREEARHGR